MLSNLFKITLFSFLFVTVLVVSQDDQPGYISLPEGRVQGIETRVKGVYRYTIPYAKPPLGSLRWQDPQAISNWNGTYRAMKMPSPCPQRQVTEKGSSYLTNEDCLYLTVYIPQRLLKKDRVPSSPSRGAPVFFWVHGGSLISGSASGYGLDGAYFANKKSLIVIVVQYRLGLLGFLKIKSSLTGNYGIKDLLMALNYVHKNAIFLGADEKRITIAGQSSGSSLIKTLLTINSTSKLSNQVILQSTPLNYGDHNLKTSELIASKFLSTLKKNHNSVDKLNELKVSKILEVQEGLLQVGNNIPGLEISEPFKPTIDKNLINHDFMKMINNNNYKTIINQRKIIFTTVKDEAGPTISSNFKFNTLSNTFEPTINATILSSGFDLDNQRLEVIKKSGIYINELEELISKNISDATRNELSVFGTDYVWRCANQQVAVNITMNNKNFNNGGEVWIGEFDNGIPYPSTSSIPFCKSKVCHEDDILSVFGIPNKQITPLQKRLINEVQDRWASFAFTGNPNPLIGGYPTWSKLENAQNLNLLKIGGGAMSQIVKEQRYDACQKLWGVKARFDSQINL